MVSGRIEKRVIPRTDAGMEEAMYRIIKFKRDNKGKTLAQFDTPEEAEKYYQTVKDKHEPFGPFLVLALELRPGGDYFNLHRKPYYREKGSWGKT